MKFSILIATAWALAISCSNAEEVNLRNASNAQSADSQQDYITIKAQSKMDPNSGFGLSSSPIEINVVAAICEGNRPIQCDDIDKEYKKCAKGNRHHREYDDKMYDCEDYAFYCSEMMGPEVQGYSYWCCDGNKKSGHGINKISCNKGNTPHYCLYEPQSGSKITCWVASEGTSPPKGWNEKKLCEHLNMPNGKICKEEDVEPGVDPNDDMKYRECSDKGGNYSSCWNCCLNATSSDSRPNMNWLNCCKNMCWGKQGTPSGSPPRCRL
jgi:hypothetical protein